MQSVKIKSQAEYFYGDHVFFFSCWWNHDRVIRTWLLT